MHCAGVFMHNFGSKCFPFVCWHLVLCHCGVPKGGESQRSRNAAPIPFLIKWSLHLIYLQLFLFISSVSRGDGEQFLCWGWSLMGRGGFGTISEMGIGILGCRQGWGGLGCCQAWVQVPMGLGVLWQGLDVSLGAGREGEGSCGGWEAAAICRLHQKQFL